MCWHASKRQIKYLMDPRTTKIPTSNFTQSKKHPQIPELSLWLLGDKMEAAEGGSGDKTERSYHCLQMLLEIYTAVPLVR